ncbi:peptide chain release factor N(5)-glutamine methyltransferase [Aquisphaera insulae]|uniref:peptide chain release factor N(5)-glutamine methyltransferase n=1 Tax=Aquisphaera insulae TaxID=2712864 RepID=UPI0020302293|nr:peptide chain release factor N(5)-glutamine methyltransferase [Aquisphaera insulae]
MTSDRETRPDDEPWTIRRLLTWTTDFLTRRGAESPRLDAEVMLAQVLGWERVQLYTHWEDIIGERARGEFRDLVRRRAEGAPVAHLVGRKEFYSLALEVSPAVLIPRPETEFVVVEFLDAVKVIDAPRAVDLGTGSGCVAIACAHQKKTARIEAIDLSPDALAVARRNAEKHGVADRIRFHQGDLLAPVADEPPFDAILSNPPYIPTADIATLEPGVRDHEPRMALDGGPDGLRVVARLIRDAAPLLRPGGHLILEIGTAQEQPVRSLIEAAGAYRLLPTVHDLRNHPRVIHAVRIEET